MGRNLPLSHAWSGFSWDHLLTVASCHETYCSAFPMLGFPFFLSLALEGGHVPTFWLLLLVVAKSLVVHLVWLCYIILISASGLM